MITTSDRIAAAHPAGRSAAPGGTDFLMCRHDHHVVARGVAAQFDEPADAAGALRDGTVEAVVGALPFDLDGRAALTAPEHLDVRDGTWPTPVSATLPTARIRAAEPPAGVHRQRIAAAIEALADPDTDLAKVVLARGVVIQTEHTCSPWALAAALRRDDPHGSVFVTDLSAGGREATLVGASPEVLIRKRGRVVSCHPLAGSAARATDPEVDARRGAALAASPKDLTEHRYVIAALTDVLAPLCRTLDIPDAPTVMATPAMWHLGTPIRGELADPELHALDLALAVHPTPAICGTPTDAARDYINSAEGDRGFYAGAVGWARRGRDGGDGEWLVTIRCAEVAGDGRELRTWAGGGIVADSNPDDEVAETRANLATVLRALDVDPALAG